MIIQSNFHDYYDSIQKMGQDKTIVYNRVETEVNIKIDFWQGFRYPARGDKIKIINEFLIGFCGKIYPVIRLYNNTNCYNIEDVDCFVKHNFKAIEFVAYKETKNNYYRKLWEPYRRRNRFKNFFYHNDTNQNKYHNLFRQYNTPIFIIESKKLIIHSELKKFNFARIFNPQLAFQEIMMYISGVLGTGNPSIPKISNDDMIESKGFNKKTSFRNKKDNNQ